jgi:hypothetical protein
MRFRLSTVLLPLLVATAAAQNRSADLSGTYRIHKLSLVSADLPKTERDYILHAFQGGTYDLDELSERVRSKLRDSGYAMVEVGPAQIIPIHRAPSARDADVSYSVNAGHRYRLSEITFEGGTIFPESQLRGQFDLQDGAIFTATKIGKGLESLKDLYGTAGYANFGAIPKPIYDQTHYTVALVIDIDQGRHVKFGKLFMEGIEPRAGAAQELLTSWKELEGKCYNSRLLKEWLKKNSVSDAVRPFAQNVNGADPGTLNVLIDFDEVR